MENMFDNFICFNYAINLDPYKSQWIKNFKNRYKYLQSRAQYTFLLPSPSSTNSGSSLHSDHTIVAPHLDHLAVETGQTKDAPHDSFVELESVRGNQREA